MWNSNEDSTANVRRIAEWLTDSECGDSAADKGKGARAKGRKADTEHSTRGVIYTERYTEALTAVEQGAC